MKSIKEEDFDSALDIFEVLRDTGEKEKKEMKEEREKEMREMKEEREKEKEMREMKEEGEKEMREMKRGGIERDERDERGERESRECSYFLLKKKKKKKKKIGSMAANSGYRAIYLLVYIADSKQKEELQSLLS